MKKKISLLLPTYNEQDNVDDLYRRLNDITILLDNYDFEFLFIDNSSEDLTFDKLKFLASEDKRIKIILNTRNFGHVRSPYWGLMQTSGDATIAMATDFQDPPELILDFINEWEKGWKVVLAVKPVSQTNFLMFEIRKIYYRILDSISDFEAVKDATGFGLYDKLIIQHITKISDPYPYLRGLVCELGFPIKTIPFNQPRRIKGISKNNFYTLFDLAMLGIISNSKAPIRIISIVGFLLSGISFLIAIFYFVAKIIFWNSFSVGLAPLIIGLFMMFGVLFLFLGVLGEYIGSIQTYVRNRPIIVEKERVNFD